MTSVTLGKNIQIIGQEVFWGCESLPSITLPASVTEIGQWCFENCLALTNVYAQPTVPPTICDYTFPSQITSQATLYVPNGCVDKYSNALYWRDFMKIENNNSGIDNATTEKTHVCVVDGAISVTGIANHTTVNIYSTNGILLHSTTEGCVSSIYLPKGIYLVQTGNEIYKVVI